VAQLPRRSRCGEVPGARRGGRVLGSRRRALGGGVGVRR
jgi:hypothetical protein